MFTGIILYKRHLAGLEKYLDAMLYYECCA